MKISQNIYVNNVFQAFNECYVCCDLAGKLHFNDIPHWIVETICACITNTVLPYIVFVKHIFDLIRRSGVITRSDLEQ